jgi:hypothetical protein
VGSMHDILDSPNMHSILETPNMLITRTGAVASGGLEFCYGSVNSDAYIFSGVIYKFRKMETICKYT